MKLTDEEKRMAAGERGAAVRLAMEVLTGVGECYGAERLLEIKSVHAGAVYPQLEVSPELMERFANTGGQFVVPTTVNPSHNPRKLDKWKGLPETRDIEGFKSRCARMVTAIEKMGVIPTWSCAPYLQGSVPRMGQHICWVESSAIVFVNSVLGARTNRTTNGVDIAAALTGRVPEFGLHLDENRVGEVLVKIEYTPKTLYDYSLLGYVMGKYCGGRVPVIEGLPEGTTANQLKSMGASAATRGGVALYHAVGLTPEARTREQASGGRKLDGIKIGEKEIEKELDEISTFRGGDIHAVVLGCPHPLDEEIKELAVLLEGKKVKEGMKFLLFAAGGVLERTRRMGLIAILERVGVEIFEGDCILWCPVREWGWKNIATDSAKWAHILPSDPTYLDVLCVDTGQCVEIGTS